MCVIHIILDLLFPLVGRLYRNDTEVFTLLFHWHPTFSGTLKITMSDLHFNEEESYAKSGPRTAVPKVLISLVMKWGLAKDNASAEKVLLIIAVILFIIAAIVPFLFGGDVGDMDLPPGYQVVSPSGQLPRLERI